MTDEQLLKEQLDCCRARAFEYDEWWERRGRYDRGSQANARERLVAFMTTCRKAVAGDGTMFFLDGLRTDETTAIDQALPEQTSEIMSRKLNDGREYGIVKNFYEPHELVAAGEQAGFEIEIQRTDTYF